MRHAVLLPLLAAGAAAQGLAQNLPVLPKSFDLGKTVANGVGTNLAADTVTEMVGGFLEGFTKDKLSEDTLTCINGRVNDVADDLLSTYSKVVNSLEAVLGPHKNVNEAVDDANQAVDNSAPLLAETKKELAAAWNLMQDPLGNCIQGALLEEIDLAEMHLMSMTYVSGALQANGADVVNELIKAIDAFNAKKFLEFGRYSGDAWRKVLIGDGQQHELPSGPPSKVQVERMSVGLLQGFFGPGFQLKIEASDGSNLEVDLHKCVGGSVMFFSAAWSAVYTMMNEITTKSSTTPPPGQWETALASAMLLLPDTMKRCEIGEEAQRMLESAMKSQQMHIALTGQMTDVNSILEQAVKDWSMGHWRDFGRDLGEVLQKTLLLMFPQAYEVSEMGTLMQRPAMGAWAVPVLAGSVGLMVVTMAVLKAQKVGQRAEALSQARSVSRGSPEDEDDEAAIE